ncbi:GntR family transcriptional regulator [uncultured Paracoccus sp.]|uniref:GntR family transcriptional regulator n=1 Tax=uncultured Paracoccus sp. TaxID=189685 RepID=UPI0025CDD516|nr:GntR family transcriptional regulator [uncultured Paracoccus sp.]
MQHLRRRRSRSDSIYADLRRRILSLGLPPGTILNDRELSERYGTSRTPVRDAVQQLAKEGLVHVAPQFATFVTPFDPVAVRQAHFLRINLETPLIQRLCTREAPDLTPARRLIARQRLALEGDDFLGFLELDDAFHHALFELEDMGGIWMLIQGRKAQLDRLRYLLAIEHGQVFHPIEQHGAILDAIETQDAHAATEVLQAHVSGSVQRVDTMAAQHPDLFRWPATRELARSSGRAPGAKDQRVGDG